MTLNPFDPLKTEARDEAYVYFDQHIRPLPKGKDGRIDPLKPGFDDNDVDAFRHAYVSGVFTQEYGEQAVNLIGIGSGGRISLGASCASPFGARLRRV
ncbi:MAG: hypothetical protein NDJ90_12755 [Oligoflexia bacterium]|nr:hypothetical protein [Oligoflexia bacterium]